MKTILRVYIVQLHICHLILQPEHPEETTCRRSVVSSGCSGFLHQKTDFIIISPPWYDPGCCWGVKPLHHHHLNHFLLKFLNVVGWCETLWRCEWSIATTRVVVSCRLAHIDRCVADQRTLHNFCCCDSKNHGPPNVRGGGARVSFAPPPKKKKLGGLGPLGLVIFTLENVLCLLFESAIPGGKKA